MNQGNARYWLFMVRYDRFPDLWKKMVEHGFAAQHYPPGWNNESRNVNALRKIRLGDRIVAAFGNFCFGGYGTITSDFVRGGQSLEVHRLNSDGIYEFAERFTCDWRIIPLGRREPYILCSGLKKTYNIRLQRGCCVKEIDARTFAALQERLGRAGAAPPKAVTMETTDDGKETRLTPEFVRDFQRLSREIEPLLQRAEQEKRNQAPDFNVLRLLDVAFDEAKTHTPILADLLNPRGSHGQGAVFLQSFIDQCRLKPGFVPPMGDVGKTPWVVQRERFTPFGNVDLVIIAPSVGYLIAIENKVFSAEQPEQLHRYSEWMTTQRDSYPNQNLVFLTPGGREGGTAGESRYVRLSYGDIAKFIESALPGIRTERVRGFLPQYIEVVRQISDTTDATDEGDVE